PRAQLDLPTVTVELQSRLAPTSRNDRMVGIQVVLLARADGIALLEQAQGCERLEETQLALIDPDRVEHTHIEGAKLDVLHSAPLQRLRGTFSWTSGPLGADVAVVLVFDLQQVSVELPVLTVNFDADLLVLRMRRADCGG